MDTSKLDNGIARIASSITNFSYEETLARLKDKVSLRGIYDGCSSGYEKLQIFRLFEEVEVENSVLQKFINETYHIENEYICQLDPTKFDLIPEYVVKSCDQCLVEAGI
ncbi:hypothetical protein BFX13_15485 [Vibrio cholerae]|nr:hypothetical protein BFX13_15485 [Vibrio cholerae]